MHGPLAGPLAAAGADHASSSSCPCSVAVIGGGAGGLVTARMLFAAGLSVDVFEASSRLGGVWSGSGAAMYPSLRTNLPRELMGFSDLPFLPDRMGGRSRDPRRYPGREEVLAYLEAYVDLHGLRPHVRLGARVKRVQALPLEEGWEVTLAGAGSRSRRPDRYDAVVVANGHYSVPRYPPGLPLVAQWGRLQVHASGYAGPAPFAGKRVAVVGCGASGADISAELARGGAAEVHLAGCRCQGDRDRGGGAGGVQVALKPRLYGLLQPVGVAYCGDGGGIEKCPDIDAVVYATGYHMSFPFLPDLAALAGADDSAPDDAAAAAVSDNCLPAFEHVFLPRFPSLPFVGLPWKVVPFPLMELQAHWLAAVLTGRAELPPAGSMASAASASIPPPSPGPGGDEGGRRRRHHHHRMEGGEQWDYLARLSARCGLGISPGVPNRPGSAAAAADLGRRETSDVPARDAWREAGGALRRLAAPWRRQLYEATARARAEDGGSYRDGTYGDQAGPLAAASEEFGRIA